jgi:hypothetical protein
MTEEEYRELRFQKAISMVLCGECKHYPYQTLYADDKCTIETYDHCFWMKADDYCSKGERNESSISD